MKKNITYIKEIIPIEVEDNTIFNIHTNGTTSFTHGFHKYPAKFIPLIPNWGIKKYLPDEGSIVLDPFCGSGTTLVESMLSFNNSVGIDIDPLSCLISKVKTTPLNIDKLEKILGWLRNSISHSKNGNFHPSINNINHWFNDDAIKKLSIIRSLIDKIPTIYGNNKNVLDIKDFLMICFSSIVRRISNADNESQKTYVSHTKLKVPEEVYFLFFNQLEYFKTRIEEFSKLVYKKAKSTVIRSNCSSDLKKKLSGYRINLVITSPPYIKAIDYLYNQMVELFWIGDLFELQTLALQNSKKKLYIGSKHFHKADYCDFNPMETKLSIPHLDEKLISVFNTDSKNGNKHSYLTYKYFLDMEFHFANLSYLLEKGTKYIMVIGDSTVSEIFFNTSNYLVDIAERNGFSLINRWGYKIKNRYMRFDRKGRGGIIDIDWVLVFEKN
ncbi:MAG: site-specific DNA-methyltransferase [Bacteroidetes bacterium]|nr:site-specific DNA-methyltransferase [Bacteroidota bacterium]